MTTSLSREQFAEAYARRSGSTIEELKEWGREPAPCDCEERGCEGWQMAHVKMLREWVALGWELLPRDQAVLDYLDAR